MSTSFPLDGKRVRFAGLSDIGRKRSHNEDSIYVPTDSTLAIIADGMGGHASGDVASQTAVETILSYFRATENEHIVTWPYKINRDLRREINRMIQSIMFANLSIFEKAERESGKKGMGTTAIAAHFLDDTAVFGHVGDSRIYQQRKGRLTQLTEDHSLINDYIKMKRVTAEEAETWPHKNVIVRALGMKSSVQVDTITITPEIGDQYLLCSDGLSGMISDDIINSILHKKNNLDDTVQTLVQAANDAGGTDNISVVLARIESAN